MEKVVSKSVSRLAAVQFAYQIELTKEPLTESIESFISNYIKANEDFKDINLSFFKKLARNLVNSEILDSKIEDSLKTGEKLTCLPILELSILRIAVIEMMYEKTDIPVIINEYIEISKHFLDTNVTRFMNALLDSLSKNIERQCLAKI